MLSYSDDDHLSYINLYFPLLQQYFVGDHYINQDEEEECEDEYNMH